jgi:ATP-dependent Lon protease
MTTAMVKQELAVASFSKVYDLDQIETALSELTESANDALRATYEKMLKVGNMRFCVKPNRMPSIDTLLEQLPNFVEPLEDVRRQVALCMETEDRLELMPMLLLGDPGIGKTHFAKAIARLFGTAYQYVGMSSLTAGWILSGASSQWKIDKANGDSQYDPLGALYALLERETAQSFIDEFAEVPINAAQVIWVATANDERSIPEPILSRMSVYEVPPPDDAGARRIAQAIYEEIRSAHGWGQRFPAALGDDALDVLAHASPRDMRRAILHGFGAARLDGRDEVRADDIHVERNTRRRPIGFQP